ncbi:MAG: AsnC family transcriptional regulator [Candidatus Lokiarchaeota archaeon]|nr:AsnC family transcriptional regulator [Candidatus Lokiarchaeota archaeon]
MDQLDKAILMELSINCRASYSKLARKYDVSVTTIKNRVNALIENRIIQGFSVQPNQQIFGASNAIVLLQLSSTSIGLLEQIGSNEFVSAAGLGLNQEGFVVTLYRNNAELAQVTELFYSLKEISDFEIFQVLPPLQERIHIPTKTISDMKRIDWKIIQRLQENGRKPLSELASEIVGSVPTIRKRLNFLRKHNLIDITILLNPGAIKKGFMVIITVQFPSITSEEYHRFENRIRDSLEDNFWVSWKVIDRPMLLLAFQASNPIEVKKIRKELLDLRPDIRILGETIGGEIKYFPDFRHKIIELEASRKR